MPITVETSGSNDHGPCECCGNMSRTVWGYLHDSGAAIAVYYVHWTVGRIDHGANFDLVIGPWGGDSTPSDRSVVAVAYRLMDDGPQFMVIDAINRPVAKSGSLAALALPRNEVIGTPLAKKVFTMLDAIWLNDNRIVELAGN